MGLCFIAFAICIIGHLDAATESVSQATVVREIWNHVRGDSIQNLLADVRFPHKPSKVTLLKTFDAPTNDGFHFAQRLKGYFIAPKTGEYKFYSSCDDECEVFLGLDGKEGESNRIISQKRSSMHNEFDRYPDQVSHSIYLEEGKSYYVEEIGRQDKGRESLSLGVELPDGKRYFPIPRKFLSKYNTRSLLQNKKPKLRKAKKKQRTDIEPSEMIEGSLGKPIDSAKKEERKTTAKGEKKSIKSDDYPEDSKVYSDRDETHAILEVDGAEIEQPESNNIKDRGQDMFVAKPNSRDSLDEFEISPHLELASGITSSGVLNEAGIEKAVEEALKQRSDKSKENESEVSFLSSDKHDAGTSSGRHRAEADNQQNKQISEDSNIGTNGSATVLEMNKIASEAGQVAMNLVNVSNFKVVIPGGKTYEISGVPGKKPLVTVMPDNVREKTGKVIENITESGVARMNKVQDTSVEKNKASYLSMDKPLGKTVTAIQHGNNIDVHVDKANDNKEIQQSLTMQALREQNLAAADSQIASTQAHEHPYPILDSSVAALMYHPEHITIDHPPVTEHPINDHHEQHVEDMHIKVNSSFPEHEAPKPQKLDPEVIKVEFLPEGISVDTSSSKITKKCEKDATKRNKQPLECNDGNMDAKGIDNNSKANNSKEDGTVETGKANAKTVSDQFYTNSNKIIPGKFMAAQETKMFVAPAMTKEVPDDVTVVPAERQEAITRVLVQDIAKDKNESNVNLVKVSPVSKVTQQFPTITGSVMNNRTGNPVPFEVKVVSNQKEAQELAGGKGTNFTISADSRTYASGIAAGPNKKGQQQTIIVLPDIYQRHTTGGSKDAIAEQSTKESGTKSIAQQHLPSPETKTSSTEKTYPVTMDTPPAAAGGGAGGEFIFPDISTLNPSSGPSLVPITGSQETTQNRQNSMPGMVMTPEIPQEQQQQQQQQPQQGQDKVLIGPPDNIYHGPILSPVASEFMADLSKGSFSTEEALDLMNNYVSGSQDMTSSIKKLAERLDKVNVRDDTQQKQGPSNNLSPQKVNGIIMGAMNGHQSFMNFPRLNEPQAGGPLINSPSVENVPAIKPITTQQFGLPTIGAPSGGEIAALLAIGPNRDYAGGEVNERFEKNFPIEQSNQRSFNTRSYQGNNEENFENYNENHQQQTLFNENLGGHDAALARMNQLRKDKPPPLHLFEGEEPGSMMQLPNENNNANMFGGGRQGAQMAREAPINALVNNPINSGFRGRFMTFMQNIPRDPTEFPSSPSNVDGFLNRIDPHEMSPNPSVAMPENGLARHTLSKRPSQENQPLFQADHLHGLTGEGKFHELQNQEFHNQASLENFHNHGNSISDMYSDSLFPEDIADIESLRGSLQGKTLSAYDRQEERQSQAQAQGRSETHPVKMPKVSYPLSAVTQASKFKGSVRSHIEERRAGSSMKKNSGKKKRRHHLKKVVFNGLQRSVLFKKKQRKEKRDLVSIVPNHRPIKFAEQSNDIILNTENVGIHQSAPGKEESLKLNAKAVPSNNVDGRADTKDSMTEFRQDSADNDKSHLKKIALELKDIINQLHNDKKKIFDIWEGQKLHEKPIMTNRVGSDYEVEYIKGKVTDEDLREKSMSSYQSPDAEKFQQDVWEPGSRGEGTMLGALVNSKRGVLAKVKKPKNEIRSKQTKRSGIANENKNFQPYFTDWKLDDEIRLLQQL